MIKYHTVNLLTIAEVLTDSETISSPEEMLDLIAEISFHGSDRMIIHEKSLHPDFFDLKSGLAGEILQKFSNYRVKLAIAGDFSEIRSKSLKDFIRECNRGKTIFFVNSINDALSRVDH